MILGDQAARVLRLMDAEKAHDLALGAARRMPVRARGAGDARLATDVLGLHFPNPVGLAAGFDKNAVVPDAMLGLGFGFVEVGTVTPLPQTGNPRPRLFRLPADGAIINRLGFNNDGHDAVADRLLARARRPGLVGVNIGANRDTTDRFFDYYAGVRMFAPLAAWLTVNVSSPNTPGLRDLQGSDALEALLGRLRAGRDEAEAECGRRPPLLVKIAPDMDETTLAAIVEVAAAGAADGLIISNTTIARPDLRSTREAEELGGLSGKPLFERSTTMVARARQLAGDRLALVAVGGVADAAGAWSKFAAGADLVQLYTGMIYEGPSLPRRIVSGLLRRLDERNIAHIRDVRGIETTRWAAGWAG